jgi:hypothetical protein
VYVGFRREAPSLGSLFAGVAVGIILSSFVTVLLTGYLFGIGVTDTLSYSLSVILVASIALFAAAFRARWSTNDPCRPIEPAARHTSAGFHSAFAVDGTPEKVKSDVALMQRD